MRPFLLPPLLLVLAGCGGDSKVAPVSGRVTLKSKPVANAAVLFQPMATETNNDPGPGSSGVTDEDGRYTLTVVGKDIKGAVLGVHRVKITPFEKDDSADDRPKKAKPKLPVKYLEFEVRPGGSESADFDLTPEVKKPRAP